MATAAELVGLANRMLELTCAYLSDRTQFGKPIGTFQALQHKAVDMWLQVQLAEAALAEALAVRADPNHDPTAAVAAVSSAKARASAAASTVGKQAVQLHGAIGFTDEYELGHLVNRALVLAAWLGNAREHTRRFADLTRERAS
jgi:alkylation response protein AidB-like acyl-CoA dehydrogenase